MGSADPEIRPLTGAWIKRLEQYLTADPITNSLFLLDLKEPKHREKSEFWLATKHGRIEGVLLVYHGFEPKFTSILLTGTAEAAVKLLEGRRFERATIRSNQNHLLIVERTFPEVVTFPAEAMVVERGQARCSVKHPVKELDERHVHSVWQLWSGFLGELAPDLEAVKEQIRRSRHFGILVGKELAAFASSVPSRITEGLWWVGGVYTKPRYRGRGFATSLVSKAVEVAFEEGARRVSLFALTENLPAKRVYGKVGFRRWAEVVYYDYRIKFFGRFLEDARTHRFSSQRRTEGVEEV